MAFGDTIAAAVLGKVSVPEDTNNAPNVIAEGAAVNTTVGITAHSTFANGNASLDYTLSADSSGGGFKIDHDTGVVTVADPSKIDFESAPIVNGVHAYTITVLATKNNNFSSEQTFVITVNDVAPSTPVDSNAAANTVLEGAANGTAVGITASSSDVNGGTVTYSLAGDTSGGGFTINAATGVVTVADGSKIDFESAPGHAYTVTVQSSDGTLTSSQAFTINVGDVAMTTPVDANGAANSVAEGAANGTAVGITASAGDPNGPATTYALTNDAGGRFAINATTGVVTVANGAAIDFETAPGPGHTYGITVQATSGAQTTTQAFSIGVTDVGPSTPTDANGTGNSVLEGAANGTPVGITASSADPGGGPAPTFALTDSAGGRFTINATTGIVTVANGAAIDFETAPGPGHTYSITVQSTAGALSSTPQTFSIGVGNVNEAPAGTDKTVTIAEDNTYTFGVADFGFSDPADSSAPNSLLAVKMTTVPGAGTGTFTNNGVTVNAGDFISATDIAAGHLVFIPALNANGSAEASFTFQVRDNGGTANGGVDLDQSPNTLTVNVTAVNDAPVNSVPATQGVNEDATLTFSSGTGNAITISDVDAGAGNETVTLTVTSGTLALGSTAGLASFTNNAASITLTGTVANVNAAMNGLTYHGNLNFNGTDTLVVSTNDNGNAGSGGAKIDTDNVTINVTSVNDAPAGTDKTVTIDEDNTYTFGVADFGFSDPADSAAPNSLQAVKMTTVPGAGTGTFTNNGVPVNAGDFISATDIANGHLVFTPALNANGSAEASFTFQVRDNGGTANGGVDLDQSPNTLTVNVSAVNDAPVNSVPATQGVNEDATLTFSSGTGNAITISDVDAGAGNETVTLTVNSGTLALGPTAGLASFTNNAASITLTGTVANINAAMNGLTYTGNLNFNGTDTLVVSTNDNSNTGSGGAKIDTDNVIINVTSVNDAPAGTDKTVTMVEGDSYIFSTADFGFSDPSDSVSPNSLLAVKMTTVPDPAAGTFTNNGITVNANDFVSATDIANGLLVFTPAAHSNGAPEASFTFQVQDNGGTANGGVDLDQSANTLSINVNAVNDAPVNSVPLATQTVNEEATLTFSSAGGNPITISDIDVGSGNETVTLSVVGGTLALGPTAGLASFTNNASSITLTGTVANVNAALDGLTYTGNLDFHGSDTLVVSTNDNSNTGSGGAKIDIDGVSITVNDLADTPSVTNATTNEDTQSASGLVVSRNATDGTDVAFFKITGITNGTLFQNNGTTAINNGDFISFAQANAGLKFTPTANFDGNGTFNVQASTTNADAGLGGSPVTATITVNAVADTPSVTNATTNEDTQSASGLVVSHNAVDGAEVGFVKITNISNGTLFQNNGTTQIHDGDFITFAEANAGLKFTPAPDFFGNGTFQVQASTSASDAGLGGSAVTATVAVSAVADTPSVTNATTNEDTQSATGLVVTHNAADGAEVGFVKITSITNGTLFQNNGTTAINNGDFITYAEANAGLKFTPAADFNGNGSFDVQASTTSSNAGLGGSVQHATITVDPVNDAPTLTAHDRDPVYAPGGVQLFDTAHVDVGPTNESTQNIKQLVLTVSDVDSTPTGSNDHLSIDGTDVFLTDGNTAVGAGHGVDILVTLSGSTATVTISKAAGDIPAADVVSIVNGLTYTNNDVTNGETPRNVTIASIQDDGGGTAPNVDTSTPTPAIISTVTFNQAPVITTDGGGPTATKSIAENTTAVTQVQATDPDSGPSPVSYSIVLGDDSAKFGIDATGHLAFLSAPDFENPTDTADTAGNNTYVVTVRASDGASFDDQTITVTVTDVNEAPVITSNGGGATASVNVDENATTVTTITATDQDVPAQTLSYSVLTGAGSPDGAKFTVDGTGHLSFSSAPNFEAPGSAAASNAYTVQVQVTDNGVPAMHDIQTITVNVQDVNEAPDTAPSSATGAEDAASIAITINGSDVDAGDSVASFHITNIPNAGTQGTLYSDIGLTHAITEGTDVTATSNAATVYFVPKPDFNTHAGAVTFNAAATDNHGGSSLTDATPAVQTINVTAVNDAPVNHAPANADLGTAFSNTNFAVSGFSVADVDAGDSAPGDIHVTLAASHGNVSVTLNGTTVASGTNGSHSVTLDGTVAQVNAALASLVYHSDDGYTGSDTLTMHTDDLGHTGSGGVKTADASVDIGIVPQVFVIDNTPAGAGNNGSLTDPFNSIASFNTNANDGAGDYIYVNAGTYSEADGINLLGSEHLYGQGQTLTFTNPVTGEVVTIGTGSAGNTPTISVTGAGAHGIDLGADDQVTGLNVATTAGSQIGINDSGASVGTTTGLTISDVDVTGAGQAVNIAHGGLLNVAIDTLTSTGSTTNGIHLGTNLGGTALTGSFSAGTGANAAGSSISGSTGTAFLVGDGSGSVSTGGTATINFGGAVSANNAGLIDIQDHATGAVTLSGTLTHTGTGAGIVMDDNSSNFTYSGSSNSLNTGASTAINITDQSGGTVAFSSPLNIDTTSGAGINIGGTNTGATFNFTGGSDTIDTTGGTGFSAAGGGTVSVTGSGNTISSGTGTALNLNGITVGGSGITFDSATTSGAANGILIDTVTGGAISVNGGSIAGATTRGVDINAAQTNITITSSIASSASGRSVEVTNSGKSGGSTIAFSGGITDAGLGIALDNNDQNGGATINFTGALNIDSTTNTGFSATNGGTINATNSANSINTSTGTALNVANTNIGSSNLIFHDISSNGGSNNGINLVNTGTAAGNGGLHVLGSGATVGASGGGVIANKTGADGSTTQGTGILLNGTKDVQLNGMQLNDLQNFAINGNNVTGFTLDHSVINGDNGTSNSVNDPLAAFSNVGEDAVRLTNLLGSGSITNSNISGGYTNTVMVENNTGTLNRLTIDHSTIGGRTDNGTGMNDGVNFQADTGSTTMNITVSNSTLTTARGGVFVATTQLGTTSDVKFQNNTVTNNHPSIVAGGGLGVDIAGLGNTTFDVSGNSFDMHAAQGGTGIKTHVIEINKASGSGSSTFDGTVANNTVGVAGVAHSGSGIGSNDIDINSQSAGTFTISILNNNLQEYDQAGIQVSQISGSSTVNATIQGNTTVPGPGANPFAGLWVVAGALASDTGTTNILIGGAGAAANDLSAGDPANANDVFLQKGTGATLNLSKGVSGAATATQVIKDNNLNPAATTVGTSGTITLVNTNPPLPLLAAPGGVEASSPTTGEMHLTQAELDSVVAAAIGQWASAGASAAQLAALHAVIFSVADLAGNIIGDQGPGAHITIDTDAAGHGWFVDPTPNDNSEFTHAQNAAGTDLLTDPSNAAAGHLDLLTTVTHELGHVLGLDDVQSPADDLMYVNLVNGERRLPDAADVAQANDTTVAQAVEAAMPLSAQAAAGTPIIVGTPSNDTINAGHGGNILFGGGGADNFVFGPATPLNAPTPAQITHVVDYSAAQGDTFDFSAITSQFHNSGVNDALVVRAVEDASGKFATLQVDHIDPMGLPSAPNWVNVAQLDGAHAGDAVNVLVDNNHSVHLAQIHVDLLV
jgi:co-chaperonin GroES (HSP10)